jgi:hypothetical protein
MSEDREKWQKENEEPAAEATDDEDVEAHQFAAAPEKHWGKGDGEREKHWGKDT